MDKKSLKKVNLISCSRL